MERGDAGPPRWCQQGALTKRERGRPARLVYARRGQPHDPHILCPCRAVRVAVRRKRAQKREQICTPIHMHALEGETRKQRQARSGIVSCQRAASDARTVRASREASRGRGVAEAARESVFRGVQICSVFPFHFRGWAIPRRGLRRAVEIPE